MGDGREEGKEGGGGRDLDSPSISPTRGKPDDPLPLNELDPPPLSLSNLQHTIIDEIDLLSTRLSPLSRRRLSKRISRRGHIVAVVFSHHRYRSAPPPLLLPSLFSFPSHIYSIDLSSSCCRWATLTLMNKHPLRTL